MLGPPQHSIPLRKLQPRVQFCNGHLLQQLQPPLLNFLTPVLHLLCNLVLDLIVVCAVVTGEIILVTAIAIAKKALLPLLRQELRILLLQSYQRPSISFAGLETITEA